ncbi:MAG TPA: helix-turn-helix domain-containing protein [Burkholderiaceae bacterium]|jgi:transcriptional regulator with XRE-family HTH domain
MQLKTQAWFGERALRLRLAKGIRQKSLATSLGVSAARLCAIERGRAIGVSSEFVDRFGILLELNSTELADLQRAAAHDRVMREAIRSLDSESADVVRDVLRVLDRGRWPGFGSLIRHLAGHSQELGHCFQQRRVPCRTRTFHAHIVPAQKRQSPRVQPRAQSSDPKARASSALERPVWAACP